MKHIVLGVAVAFAAFGALLPPCAFALAQEAATTIVHYPAPESADDSRQRYYIDLLSLALTRTAAEYGPARLEPAAVVMNEERLMNLLVHGDKGLDLMIRPTSTESEALLEPIRIPLDKGLLGFRIFLIRAADKAAFAAIRTPEQLKALRLGQGRDWQDVRIYQGSGFRVVTGAIYEGLFEMLAKDRFDFFPRGIEEAFPEYEARKSRFPQLAVEETLLVYYPFPRYLWITRSPEGDRLKHRFRTGLELLIKDGSLDRLFWKANGETITKAQLHRRLVISLLNPLLPAKTPLSRPELWFNPTAAVRASDVSP